MNVRQRQPRIEDPAWLAAVRLMPCTICGKPGSDPAHIRSASPHYGKDITGFRKPDDKWVLPLCRHHHDEQHARGDELAWWLSYGIADPFALAAALYEQRPPRRERRKRATAPKPRKVKADRKPIRGRTDIPSRPFPEQHRPIPKRAKP